MPSPTTRISWTETKTASPAKVYRINRPITHYLLPKPMYFSTRAGQLRSVLVAVTNGTITLIILLIAPLGLAAVLINTVLVTVSTYAVSTLADRIMAWLSPEIQAELLSELERGQRSLSRYLRNLHLARRR